MADWNDGALLGGDGYDTLTFDTQAAGIVTLSADAAIERILSTVGGGSIDGRLSDVGMTLVGNVGTDYLLGGSGADVMSDGGSAPDYMRGGGGADVFKFGPEFGIDDIGDFQVGVDQIDLSAHGVAFEQLEIGPYQGSSAYVYLTGVGSIMLQGVNATSLSVQDFVF